MSTPMSSPMPSPGKPSVPSSSTPAGSLTEPAVFGPTPVSPTWRLCRFGQLDLFELSAIYRARQEIFSVEQNCAYLDVDGHDPGCHHLAAWGNDRTVPLAYARIVDPGIKYAEPSIGRVLTTAAARGTGLGRELVRRALAHCVALFPGQGIRISAQTRLCVFYAEVGFFAVGEPYLEDAISHTEMMYPASR